MSARPTPNFPHPTKPSLSKEDGESSQKSIPIRTEQEAAKPPKTHIENHGHRKPSPTPADVAGAKARALKLRNRAFPGPASHSSQGPSIIDQVRQEHLKEGAGIIAGVSTALRDKTPHYQQYVENYEAQARRKYTAQMIESLRQEHLANKDNAREISGLSEALRRENPLYEELYAKTQKRARSRSSSPAPNPPSTMH